MWWPLIVVLLAGSGQAPPPRAAPPATTMPVVVTDEPLRLPADPLRIPARGAVVLETVIGTAGEVGEVTIVEAPDAVTGRAAADALRRWRFDPALRDARPIPSTARFTYPLGTGEAGPLLGVSTDVAFPIGEGTAAPRLSREIRPDYPASAQRGKISGNVQLSCVVLPDGTATDVRVRESLDPGLDQAAIDALRKWVFLPGRRAGMAVPVVVEVEFAFRPRH